MQVTVVSEPELIIATIAGRFDAHSVDAFDAQVVGAIDEHHRHVIVDLSSVEFMDSSALAALVRALKATVALSGSITLVDVSDAARIIFELTRLDAVFATATTMADARARALTPA